MPFLQDQVQYENCMSGLEKNDYFTCQEHIEQSHKFSKCMKDLSKNRISKLKIKRKLELQNEDLNDDDNTEKLNTKDSEPKKKIYDTVSKLYNLREFTQILKPEGLNPFTNRDSYNHNILIDDIIRNHFQKTEDIDSDIMKTYMDN